MSSKIVAIVGGGFSGALLGLKLREARPDWRIDIIEAKPRIGRGIAYGACAPEHMLNVPVARMELGLSPGFADWLARGGEMEDAVAEAGGDMAAAFAPRRLFGDYIEAQLKTAVTTRGRAGLHVIRGEAVRLLAAPRRGLLLTDGREVEADIVVLAMGNLPPRPPGGPDRWLYDTGTFIPDPWAVDAFQDLEDDEPLLLIGTGLTMVDVALHLDKRGHRGAVLAVSRRGLLPQTHRAGGNWRAFLQGRIPASPLALLRLVRQEVARAQEQGVPWQRVFDAIRPAVPTIWESWSAEQRRQFVRHLRPRWDIHRHRMAPRVANALHDLMQSGRIETLGGRIAGFREIPAGVAVTVRARKGGERLFEAGRVINCTGPGADFGRIAIPLIADLRERGAARADPLGIGFETSDCAVLDANGRASDWLFALGPLTRPAWWEIVAVPEIKIQIDRLVDHLVSEVPAGSRRLTTSDFLDIGEGI